MPLIIESQQVDNKHRHSVTSAYAEIFRILKVISILVIYDTTAIITPVPITQTGSIIKFDFIIPIPDIPRAISGLVKKYPSKHPAATPIRHIQCFPQSLAQIKPRTFPH